MVLWERKVHFLACNRVSVTFPMTNWPSSEFPMNDDDISGICLTMPWNTDHASDHHTPKVYRMISIRMTSTSWTSCPIVNLGMKSDNVSRLFLIEASFSMHRIHNVNVQRGLHGNALQVASVGGHEGIVRLLLQMSMLKEDFVAMNCGRHRII